MKKISLCLVICCFCLGFKQNVSATINDDQIDNKKDFVQIDMSNYDLESEFLVPFGLIRNANDPFQNFIEKNTTRLKTLGKKALPVLPYIVFPALYVGYQYYTSTNCDPDAEISCDEDAAFTLSNMGTSAFNLLGGSYLTAGLFSNKIQEGFTTLKNKILPASMQSGPRAKMMKYQEKMNKRFSKGKISEKTKRIFDSLVKSFINCEKYGSENSEDAKSCVEQAKKIYKLPSNVKKFDYQLIKPRLEKLLETYPVDIQEKIREIVQEIVLSSHSLNPEKKIICFYGPPGTGKTHLAQQIAEILELSITCFKPSSAGAEKMIAQSIGMDDPELMLDLFSHKKNNFKNNILFIDEFDCCLSDSNKHRFAFRDFFTEVCEKSQPYYKSGKIYNLDIDMSSAIIIMAGNNLPKDAAIFSRIPVIEFKDVPKDKQLPIACNAFREGLKNYKLSEEITEEDENVLQEIVNKNTFPGVRVLKAIVDKYVLHHAKRAYLIGEIISVFNVDDVYQEYIRNEVKIESEIKTQDEPESQQSNINIIKLNNDNDIIDV